MVVPKVDSEHAPAWTVDVEAGLLAGMTETGADISAADDGRRLARWTEGPLYGWGQRAGVDRRPIRDLAFLDQGEALVMYDTRHWDQPNMASKFWLWRWRTAAPQMLSAQIPVNNYGECCWREAHAHTITPPDYNEGGDHLTVKPGAIFYRPAIAVGALVGVIA